MAKDKKTHAKQSLTWVNDTDMSFLKTHA